MKPPPTFTKDCPAGDLLPDCPQRPGPFLASGQELGSGIREAYFRAVADHFGVPVEEVDHSGGMGPGTGRGPGCALSLRQGRRVSDALIGMRRGRTELDGGGPPARVSELGPFIPPFRKGSPLGRLTGAYEKFRSRPARDWDAIELGGSEIVSLVNLKVLSEQVEVSPLRVLESREEAREFPCRVCEPCSASFSGP